MKASALAGAAYVGAEQLFVELGKLEKRVEKLEKAARKKRKEKP